MAKDFLNNYQTFTGNSFYGTLSQTLNGITGDGSVTKSDGNMTLKVQNSDQTTVDYVWTYTDANGINAQNKKVILSYYNGQLNCFLDNWNLYNIVGSAKISREQAIEIALASVQNYSYQVSDEKGASTVSVSGFKYTPKSLEAATLSYVNCPDASLARDGNSYNLYSSWWIPIGFDKFYPGDVTGIAVTVWADTGEVGSIELMYADSNFANATNTIQPTTSTDNKVNQSTTTLTLSVTLVAVVCSGFLLINKVRLVKFSGFKKILALLFCSLIALNAMASVVNANTVFANSSARIYGALEGGNGSPEQSQEEKDAANWVQTQLSDDFANSGYTAYSNVEAQTTVANVLGNASSDASIYDRCTVFHYGHMGGYGVGYVDNTGNAITYSAIDNQVENDKYKFVLLWVCCQAQVRDGEVAITPICDAWLNNGTSNINGLQFF
jgi:hypothetical protein